MADVQNESTSLQIRTVAGELSDVRRELEKLRIANKKLKTFLQLSLFFNLLLVLLFMIGVGLGLSGRDVFVPAETATPTLTPTPTFTPTPQVGACDARITVATRLYDAPSATQSVTTVPTDAFVQITARTLDRDWYQVYYEGKAYWIIVRFVLAQDSACLNTIATAESP